MNRSQFIKNSLGMLGASLVAPGILKNLPDKKSDFFDSEDNCNVWPTETEGPFPTHNPSTLAISDIIGDRTGVAFTFNINLVNLNQNCGAYEGAIVDIWHCDKDGNYSEYGGTQMQQTNYTNYHFLRGRQVSNSDGLVSFTSIFPGWYQSRATHIHVHIYTASGTSLKVTQIAFPEGSNSAVVTVNSATAYGYTKGMTGYTYNANDNVFSDDSSGQQIATVTGSLSAGYVLECDIVVAGPILGIDESENQSFSIGQNSPKPMVDSSIIPLSLKSSSKISLDIFDISGKHISQPISRQIYAQGSNKIPLDRNQLSSGIYFYRVKIENEMGTFVTSKKFIVK